VTYISVPLKMLIDEPEGGNDSHNSEETGYDPANVMRYDNHTRLRTTPTTRTGDHSTDLEIPHCRAERERAPSGEPWAESRSHFST